VVGELGEFIRTFLLNWYLNEVEGEGRGLVGVVELSWHHAAVGRDLTCTIAKCQNPN
jgi:hypothetical protein